MKLLQEKFYARNTELVARELLRKILVHKSFRGKIVETEAYFGAKDPASRAFGGKKTKLNAGMWDGPGKVFVYTVHANEMFNTVTGQEGEPAAVLIRAVEPWREIGEMFRNRRIRNKKIIKIEQLCSGPGKRSQCFKIDKRLQGADVTKLGDIFVLDNVEIFQIESSHRIGVSRDLRRSYGFILKEIGLYQGNGR